MDCDLEPDNCIKCAHGAIPLDYTIRLTALSLSPSEQLFMQMADRLVEDGFLAVGYEYVNIDVRALWPLYLLSLTHITYSHYSHALTRIVLSLPLSISPPPLRIAGLPKSEMLRESCRQTPSDFLMASNGLQTM